MTAQFVFKVLGGSSCTNVCLHHRGSAQDYNDWNVPGWTASDVLPFFKAVQKDETGRSAEFHGTGGEWVMDDVKYQNPLSKRFLEVGEAAGLGTNDDFNNWSRPQDGVGRFQVSEYKGERCSGATAFLKKAMRRKNLKVRTGTMVRKINFDSSKTATGVTYDLMGDDTCKVSAKDIVQSVVDVLFSEICRCSCNVTVIHSNTFPRWRGTCHVRSCGLASAPDVQWNWSCQAP